MVVHHHPVHHPRFFVLTLHAQDIAVYAVVEGFCGYLDLFLGLADIVPEGEYLVVCHGNEVIGNEERSHADYQAGDSQGSQNPFEGYSGSLDRQEFVVLAEGSQRHHRRKEGRKRKRKGQQGRAAPSQKFEYYLETQSFAHQFIYVQPQELHHQDEHHDQQDRDERSYE